MQEQSHRVCDDIFASFDIDEKRAIVAIVTELKRAEHKHPAWPADLIHQVAIVAEESGELVRAALNFTYEESSFYEIHKEAIQTAATCLRLLSNLPALKQIHNQKSQHHPTRVTPLGMPTTIGDLRKLIESYSDSTSFGFRNQPLQQLLEVIPDVSVVSDQIFVVFQEKIENEKHECPHCHSPMKYTVYDNRARIECTMCTYKL